MTRYFNRKRSIKTLYKLKVSKGEAIYQFHKVAQRHTFILYTTCKIFTGIGSVLQQIGYHKRYSPPLFIAAPCMYFRLSLRSTSTL